MQPEFNFAALAICIHRSTFVGKTIPGFIIKQTYLNKTIFKFIKDFVSVLLLIKMSATSKQLETFWIIKGETNEISFNSLFSLN